MGTKKMMKNLFPLMFDWDKKEAKEEWKNFKSSLDDLWDQYQDMEKSAKKAWKEQWETFFAQLMGIEQTVADALPDEKVSVPGMPAAPVSPKEIVEKAKEFQETANAHAVEQADKAFDYRMQQQQKVKEIVTDAVQKVEDNLDEMKAAAEEKK